MEWKQETNRIFSTSQEGNLVSEATFLTKDGIITVDHVYVNPTYRGQGIANEAMLAVIDYLRNNHLKLAASCPYAITWIENNGYNYKDVLV